MANPDLKHVQQNSDFHNDGGQKKKKADEELTDEMQRMKEAIERSVAAILQNEDESTSLEAIQAMSTQLKTSTATMTSVPLPLKFLRVHFDALEQKYLSLQLGSPSQVPLADMLSFVATVASNTTRKALHYRLRGSLTGFVDWGPEYLRNLCTEIVEEYEDRQTRMEAENDLEPSNAIEGSGASTSEKAGPMVDDDTSAKPAENSFTPNVDTVVVIDGTNDSAEDNDVKMGRRSDEVVDAPFAAEDLINLSMEIVSYYAQHRNELEAIDLLMELQRVDLFLPYIDKENFMKVARYVLAASDFSASIEEAGQLLAFLFTAALEHKYFAFALQIALRTRDDARVLIVLRSVEDPIIRKQLYIMLANVQWRAPDNFTLPDDRDGEVASVLGNNWLPELFKVLGEELDVLEPKSPDDVNKSGRRQDSLWVDTAQTQLAQVLVNCFVNAGFGTDALLEPTKNAWIHQTKSRSTKTAAASLGAIHLWNVEQGLDALDKLRWASEPAIKSGALIGFGACCSAAQQNSCDPAFALLADELEKAAENSQEKEAAIFGLALSQAGSRREDLLELLVPYVIDVGANLTISAFAALAIGLCFVGSSDEAAAECLLESFLERQATMEHQFDEVISYLFPLSLALVFLGKREMADPVLEALSTIERAESEYAYSVVSSFAWAFSGDVTRVQQFLKECVDTVASNGDGDSGSVEGDTSKATKAATAATIPAANKDDNISKLGPENPTQNGVAESVPEKSEKPANLAPNTTGPEIDSAETAINSTLMLPPSRSDAASAAGAAGAGTGTGARPKNTADEFGYGRATKATALMAMPLIALGESIGAAMQPRLMNHLLQFGSPAIRRAVPLALSILYASNPQPAIVDTLSKLSHESEGVSIAALYALGIVGAGTNNAKIADVLRNRKAPHGSDSGTAAAFAAQVALGLLYTSKGLVTLSPLTSDGVVVNPVALGCLLVVLHGCVFSDTLFLDAHSCLLFTLLPALRPRYLMAVDENMKPLQLSMRVGQAVETAGQAGQHTRAISGFQTHTTPLLLAAGERAELATEDWEPVLHDIPLEGVVLFKKPEKFFE